MASASSAMAMASQTHLSSVLLPPMSKFRVKAFSSHFPTKPSNQSAQLSSLIHYNPQNLRPNPISITRNRTQVFAFSSSSSSSQSQSPTILQEVFLSGSTRTLASLFALALSLSHLVLKLIHKIPLPIKAISLIPRPIWNLESNVVHTMGPLFFAALRDRPSGYLNTPLTVVAAGLSKWLDIYSGVLMVRVLLSWFPNIPWERQPLSAIRDLCDPYLNLFRNIIPPIFNTLDISPLLAFAVLGTLGSILNNSRLVY